MKVNILETVTGAAVIAISVLLLIYGYSQTHHNKEEGYVVTAKFNKADGLVEGSDVKIAGIKIGSVSQMKLDPQRYTAVIKMQINNDVQLPTDTSAAIISQSLLGGKYLDLQPGGDEEMMKDGDEIQHTQSSVILESLIGQLIFSSKESKNKK